MATKKEAFRKAFVASIPILCSYLFLGMAYGILMQDVAARARWQTARVPCQI